MGAKQSKRSVDISGKEADGAGEVAAAGAGGEGRVEQLADPDALKAQINGDAHIHEQSDKEKELDSGTPENEKDATTEKEGKEPEGEKDSTPITNGEGDQKTENGESTTAEEAKKPKKEKVKKKWSLRSISFSRKDKPKQEKKQKEEEPKANGEPEKLPEETIETTTPESPVNEVAEEVKPSTETKEEKAPETPVTEPITNGSSTPESPKVETPVIEESVVANAEIDRPEPKGEIEPEQLPVNGLSLAEPIQETSEVVNKIEEIVENKTETTEVVPVPEIPVIKEVCVTSLIEPSPPPLPANPPPSCVASFAATTMAPELTAASLSNTETEITTELPTLDVKVIQNETCPDTHINLTNIQTVTNIPIIKDSFDESISLPENETEGPILETLAEKLKDDDIMENVQAVISETDIPLEESKIVNNENGAVKSDYEETVINNITIEIVDVDKEENAMERSEENAKSNELTKGDEMVEIKATMDNEVNMSTKEDVIKTIEDKLIPETNNDLENIPVIIKKDNIETESNTVLEESSSAFDDNAKHHISNNCTQEEVGVVESEENIILKDANTDHDNVDDSKSNVIEMEIPISNDTEKLLETDDTDDLPPPPPLMDDLGNDDNDIATPNETTVENINESVVQTNEVNLKHDTDDKTESSDMINESDKELKQEITETPIESVEDVIVTEVNMTEPTPMEDVDTLKAECEKVTAAVEELLPSSILEDSETTAGAGSGVGEGEGAEVCQREEPSPPVAVDALPNMAQDPICEKMVDLIPELPAVPELKTEMLQETSNDVVVAN